jgi:hypoxanthine phosphoribosyltransferase
MLILISRFMSSDILDELIMAVRSYKLDIVFLVITTGLSLVASIPETLKLLNGEDTSISSGLVLAMLLSGFLLLLLLIVVMMPKRMGFVNSDLRWKDVAYSIKHLGNDIEKYILSTERIIDPQHNLIIGIDRGGAIVAGMLGKRLKIAATTIGIRYASNFKVEHRGIMTPVNHNKNLDNVDLGGVRTIILVDDVIRTGEAMSEAKRILEQKKNGSNNFVILTASILVELLWDGQPAVIPTYSFYEAKKSSIRFPWDVEPDD